MPRLIVMRHAKAANAARDFDRPLSDRGRLQAAVQGQAIGARVGTVDLALVSAAHRTRQTLVGLESGGLTITETWYEDFLYGAGPDDVIAALRLLPPDLETVLVVGHEPTMSYTAELLSDGSFAQDFGFSTGTAAFGEVEAWDRLVRGSVTMTEVLSPAL